MAEEVKIIVTAQDNFSGVLGNFGNIVTGIRSAVSLAADAFNAIVAPVVDFTREAAFAAARVDELALVNRILAENAGIASETIPGLVDALRDSGIEAGIAQETVAQMIRAELDLANATDIARVAQDAAVISGMNSSETLDNIIYGITTLNPLVLRHAGIVVDLQLKYKEWAEESGRTVDSLTTAEKQQIAMNAVLEAGEAIAGAYTEAMGNAFKQFGSFPRYIDDIKVAIGDFLQPVLSDIIFSMADFLKWLGKAVEDGGALEPVLTAIGIVLEKISGNFSDFVDNLLNVDLTDNPFIAWLNGLLESSTVIDEVLVGIRSAKENFEEFGTLDPTPIYEIVEKVDADMFLKNLKDDIVKKLKDLFIGTDWGDVSDALIEKINGLEFGEIGTEASKFSESVKKIISVIADQLREFEWIDVGKAIDEKTAEAIDTVNWYEVGRTTSSTIGNAIVGSIAGAIGLSAQDINWGSIMFMALHPIETAVSLFFSQTATGESIQNAFASFAAGLVSGIGEAAARAVITIREKFSGIGQGIVDGLQSGLATAWVLLQAMFVFPFQLLIDTVKRLLGIASPSSVFMEIGKNIILGLINGIISMAGTLLAAMLSVVQTILGPLSPILDLIGIDLGSLGGNITLPPIGTGGGGTVPGIGQTINNYFYGPSYFGVSPDAAIRYDCPSPNPIMTAGQGLLTSGV